MNLSGVTTRTLFLLLLLVKLLPAQDIELHGREAQLTGSLRADLLWGREKSDTNRNFPIEPVGVKSPLRAALYSAVLPGAGEFYVGDHWRAAAFLASEAALWIVYAAHDSKGDRQTRLFEQFADDHYSVVRYAEWMERHASQITNGRASCSGIVTSTDPSLPPWLRIDWNKLNMCEEEIGKDAPTGFSHRLPRRPDQQYYELIGKYEQYNPGWADVDPLDSEANHKASTMFLRYRDMRGKANDYYNIATTFSYLLVANHLFSALDAALLASRHNKQLSLEAHLQPMQRQYGFIEFVPTVNIQLMF